MKPELEAKIRAEVAQLEGWTTPERAVAMGQLILDITEPQILCVEIGVFGGRSLIAQGLAIKEKGQGVIYGIDPWRVAPALEGENKENRDWWSKVDLEGIHRQVMHTIWRLGLDEQAIVIRACSQHVHNLFSLIDVLFIDGNHSEIASVRDAELYLPHVASGGYVWADDTDWASTKAMQERIKLDCDLVQDHKHWQLWRKR